MPRDLIFLALEFLLVVIAVILVKRCLAEKGVIHFLWICFWLAGLAALLTGFGGDTILAAVLLNAALLALIGAAGLEYLKRGQKE